jgi:hypothetical protein
MSKIAAVLAIATSLVISSMSANAGQDYDTKMAEAVHQLTIGLQRHDGEIKSLQGQQVAANTETPAPTASTEPRIPSAPPAPAAIGYVRYDRAVRDCKGFVIVDPANRESDAKKFNAMTDAGYNLFISDCASKRTAEEFAAEKRRAEKLQQAQVPPPAPGAIQDENRDVAAAENEDDTAPKQAQYRGGGYNDAAELAILRNRARRMLGERGIEGAYSFQELQRRAPPRPGCTLDHGVVDRASGHGYDRWHCPRRI